MGLSFDVKRFLIFLLVLAALVQPALAFDADWSVSDNITLSVSTSDNFDPTSTGDTDGAPPSSTTTQFYHRFTDAKIISQVTFKEHWTSSLGYTKYDTVPFTATVDSTYYGEGLIIVQEQLDGDVWFTIDFDYVDVDYANTLAGAKTVYLSYDSGVWDGVNQRGGTYYFNLNGDSGLTAAAPTGLNCQGSWLFCHYAGESDCTYVSYYNFFDNSYEYSFNETYNVSTLSIDKLSSSSKWSVYDSTDEVYFEEATYALTDIEQSFPRQSGVYANVTFNAGGGTSVYQILDANGTAAENEEEEDDYIPCEVSVGNSTYYRGDMVTVHYNTSQSGELRVYVDQTELWHQRTISGPTVNGTWTFYVSDAEPYGLYQVMLTDSFNNMLDTAYYNLTSSGSVLSIVPESSDLYDNIFIWYQTVNESILSIVALSPDPDVEVFNISVNSSTLTYLEWTPTVYSGGYNFYLYDDETLDDYVYVTYTEEPVVPTPTSTEDEDATEEVLDEDESMTDYYNGKFREYAPTAWGMFILSMLLWLLAVVSSFGGGKGGRRRR